MRNRPRERGPGVRRRLRSRCRTPAAARLRVVLGQHRPAAVVHPAQARGELPGQPRSATRPTLRHAPWVTTMPVSPRRARPGSLVERGHASGRAPRWSPHPATGGARRSGQPGGVLGGERSPRTRRGSGRSDRPRRTRAAVGPSTGQAGRLGDVRRRLAARGPGRWTTAGPAPRRHARRDRARPASGRSRRAGCRRAPAPGLGVPRGLPVPEQDEVGSPLVVGPTSAGSAIARAVAPQPLEGVELPLLLVLDVHDDLAVVDEHPATVTFALATDRLGAELAQLVLDLVDDRLDLAVVGPLASRNASVIASCSLTSKATICWPACRTAARRRSWTSSMAWSVAVIDVSPRST